MHKTLSLLVVIHTISCFFTVYVIVRPLSTVGYTSIASVIHSRQWSN